MAEERDEIVDPPGPSLESLGDVRRELAVLYRRLRRGMVQPEMSGVMVNCLTSLARVFQDQRDALWTKRMRKLWEASPVSKAPSGEADAQH